MDDSRLVAVPDFLIEGHSYIFTKTFDAYLCGIGRVTVHKDVICKFTSDRKLYFFRSENTLPYEATRMIDRQIKEYLLDITELRKEIQKEKAREEKKWEK